MDLLAFLRNQARANRIANHRLHASMRPLSHADYIAPRTSFFPSLAATLEHILAVDLYYIAALHGERDMERVWSTAPHDVPLAALAEAQAASDRRFIAHLINHQVHHRGQAHAMLAGTAVKPPQLDEFLMPSEAHFRDDDLRALGWTEEKLFS